MDKILITGGGGSLGKELIKQGCDNFNIIHPTSESMNILDIKVIEDFVLLHKPKYLIHSAAITKLISGDDVVNAINVNIIGTSNIVKICKKHNIKLIYISTDYVYPCGSKDVGEESGLQPMNSYGWSKLGGECSVQMYSNSLILRLSFIDNPFPYDVGPTNIIRNVQYIDVVSKTVLFVLNEVGVLNVGGDEIKSMYQLGLETNPNIQPTVVGDSLAEEKSITLDISKLKKLKL